MTHLEDQKVFQIITGLALHAYIIRTFGHILGEDFGALMLQLSCY